MKDLSFILNELGEDREFYYNAVAPPVMQTSNFSFPEVAAMRSALQDEFRGMVYSRGNNPTLNILRQKLAALDGAEDSLVFASGMAAITTPILSLVSAGDHIVSVARPYSWTRKFFESILSRFGVGVSFVDGRDIRNFEEAIRPGTRLFYLESPNTLSFELQDLAGIASLAGREQILTLIDNSYCSPLYQQPIVLGIDLSVQSATKYIGGHSDVVAGVLCGRRALIQKIYSGEFMNLGGILAPWSAWLLLRGLRTLEIRLDRISRSTLKIVDYLSRHPEIEKVLYPLHPGFPQYELACRQMKGAGGLFSLLLKDRSISRIEGFCNELKHFQLAVSWGGHESLVFPSCASIRQEDFRQEQESNRLIRFYVGLEDPDYLIKDLEQALDPLP